MNPNFGNLLDPKINLSVVNMGGRSQVLFYYAGDVKWWLLTLGGSNPNYKLQWSEVADTRGECASPEFGDLSSPHYREIWSGDLQPFVLLYDNSGPPDKVLVHSLEPKGPWWLGVYNSITSKLNFTQLQEQYRPPF